MVKNTNEAYLLGQEENINRSLKYQNLFSNAFIFIEKVEEGGELMWPKEFEIASNRIKILFNNPYI